VAVVTVRTEISLRDEGGRQAFALAGIVGVLVLWVTVLVLGALDPDYSHVEHAMGLVGSVQAPYSPFGRAAFVLEGVLLAAFSVGLYRDLRPGAAGTAGVAAIAIHGIGRVGEGVFAWNILQPGSLGNTLHLAFGVPAVLSMLAAPLLLAWAFRADDRWRRYHPHTAATAVAFVGVFVFAGPLAATALVDVPLGLGQRVGFGIWYLWLIGVAVGLYRRGPSGNG
jgi:hypothetical membrane protein